MGLEGLEEQLWRLAVWCNTYPSCDATGARMQVVVVVVVVVVGCW